MRFCPNHWTGLQSSIEARNLSQFVAKTSDNLVTNFLDFMNRGATKDNFEPLLAAHFAIIQAFLEDAGPNALGFRGCPLCVVKQNAEPGTVERWIEGASDDQLNIARNIGLLPPVQ